MTQSNVQAPPAKWQVTATTIQCDLVNEFVTILIKGDWTMKCVWYEQHKQKALEDKKHKPDKSIRLKIDKCTGPDCSYVIDYRDKLIKEESSTN